MHFTSELHRKQLIDRKLGHHGLTGVLFNNEIYFAEQHRSIVCTGTGMGYTVAKSTPITSLKNGEGYCKVLQLKHQHNGENAFEKMLRLSDEQTQHKAAASAELLQQIETEMRDAFEASDSQFVQFKKVK